MMSLVQAGVIELTGSCHGTEPPKEKTKGKEGEAR
jgi:hypothetical protein